MLIRRRNKIMAGHLRPLSSMRLFQFSALGLIVLSLTLLPACSGSSQGNSETSPMRRQQSTINVGVVTVERKDLIRRITLPGTLVAFNEATLYGKITGYLRSISVDKGDSVRRGQTLAVLEIPEMTKETEQAEAAYQEALASLNRAKSQAQLQGATYARYEEVHRKDPDAISKQELDEYRSRSEVGQAEVALTEAKVATARANHERLIALSRYMVIAAPFSGVVTARFVDPGALIQATTSSNQPVVTVQDLDTIRVYVSVPEVDVALIRNGTPASLTNAAYPGKVFKAFVTRYAEALDPATRTMKAEIDVPNSQHLLRPGMYADVTLEIQKIKDAFVIPDSALVVDGSRKFVWVVRDAAAHRVEIEMGTDDGIEVEIRSGLHGAEQVVVAGKDGLAEGKPVAASQAKGGKL